MARPPQSAHTAVRRFGLGPRPGEVQAAETDPRGWLLDQLAGPDRGPKGDSSGEILRRYLNARRTQLDVDDDASKAMRKQARTDFRAGLAVRQLHRVQATRPFRERLISFWSNHFTVSVRQQRILPVACAFEREAIRPHITGRFVDMLLAVEQHPAMLVYLDNHRSIGPGSRAGRRKTRQGEDRGLNENLAREILELHTVGVDGGYDQDDVAALARLLTGWSVIRRSSMDGTDPRTGFQFYDRAHDEGQKSLLGRSYDQGGQEEGLQALTDLAHDPATARHLATKLARHFVADNPPESAINTLEEAWLDSDGDLLVVSRALVQLDEAWEQAGSKVADPEDWLTAVGRAVEVDVLAESFGRRKEVGEALVGAALKLGQLPLSAPSPAGWPDDAASLVGGEALIQRLELAEKIGDRLRHAVPDAHNHAAALFGDALSQRTGLALQRAPDRSTAIALLLCSPELVRR